MNYVGAKNLSQLWTGGIINPESRTNHKITNPLERHRSTFHSHEFASLHVLRPRSITNCDLLFLTPPLDQASQIDENYQKALI